MSNVAREDYRQCAGKVPLSRLRFIVLFFNHHFINQQYDEVVDLAENP